MAIYVRPFVTSITHVEGCPKRNCGPACARETSGWEYHIKLVLPTGAFFEERKKSPVNGKANTQRYAEERAAHAIRESVAPQHEAKKEVPTVAAPCVISNTGRAYSGMGIEIHTRHYQSELDPAGLDPVYGNDD